jgi:hypothetical protein
VGRPVRIRDAAPDEPLGALERLQTWDAEPGVKAAVHLNRCGPAAFAIESGDFWFRYDADAAAFTVRPTGDPAFREALLWESPTRSPWSWRETSRCMRPPSTWAATGS